MGSLGLPELAFIFVLALLIFGPKKLPEIGRTLGKGMAEFRKATNELKRSINTELALEEMPKPSSLRSLALDGLKELEREVSQPGEAPPLTEPRAAPAPESEPEPAAAAEALESR
jgi:TatA/E family protein of Tat protein translocase